jgi:hypothetical protein
MHNAATTILIESALFKAITGNHPDVVKGNDPVSFLKGVAVSVATGVIRASVVTQISVAVVIPVRVRIIVAAIVRTRVVVGIGVAVAIVRPIVVVVAVAWYI